MKIYNKNIVIILKSFVFGGAEKQALFLANHLQNELACNVYIYSYIRTDNSKQFYSECKNYNLNNIYIVSNPLSASGNFKYLKRRIKIAVFGLKLRKHKPDIIIPYLNPPSIIANLCYKFSGAKKTFWHHRGADYYRDDKLEQKAFDSCPMFIANSFDGLNELKGKSKLKTNNFVALSNFSTINKTFKSDNLRSLFKIENKTVVIGMVAHFRIQKLQHLLVLAANELMSLGYNIHIILAGYVQESEEEMSNFKLTKDFIEKFNINDKVSIIHDKKAFEILGSFDIGVLFSEKEGMPNAIMEYMAFGLPVVATKHSGCITLLDDDYGFFVNKNDVNLIKEKLEILVKDKPLRESIGAKLKTRIEQVFSIDKYIQSLEKILNN